MATSGAPEINIIQSVLPGVADFVSGDADVTDGVGDGVGVSVANSGAYVVKLLGAL